MNNKRLIETGFPCHQVGAETQRERGASSALPPLYFLHVWWARRPLTPSRAAILASILPAETNSDEFLIELGISRKCITLDGIEIVIPETLPKNGNDVIQMDDKLFSFLDDERKVRAECKGLISIITRQHPELKDNHDIRKWEDYCQDIPECIIAEGQVLNVITKPADPAWFSSLLALSSKLGIRVPNLYGYDRAYKNQPPRHFQDITVLDPTAGGGSIPYEALRLGCNVISNDLNPVASVIQYATLQYPGKYGVSLTKDIQRFGGALLSQVNLSMRTYFDFNQKIPDVELSKLKKIETMTRIDTVQYEYELPMTYLYTRIVTCPNCGGQAPLMNSCWLSKTGEKWAVRVLPDGNKQKGKVSFEPYIFSGSHGPYGEDPDFATVKQGVGTCIHCKQAIPADEIKSQAQGKSKNGTWWDQPYCVAAVRHQPKLDKNGKLQYFKTGEKAGEIKTEKISFFRAPTAMDFDALARANRALDDKWDEWDRKRLIPTEAFPEGNDMRPVTYGMNRWCDMFLPRQLLGHLTAMETLIEMKPEILADLGKEKGRAVITYLQFMIDKCVDYNSRQTRWIPQRGSLSGTFSRHDFSLKWTFGEMVFSGPSSGLAWGLSQVIDAYEGIAELIDNKGKTPRITILNGSAASMSIESQFVDVICIDPPYYNNVQYAELSDFFYIWQKRSLGDIYPDLYNRVMTNKQDEAVANPTRDGTAKKADKEYERLMREIFEECHRVLKLEGIMTMMFTHKTQEAWETLTKALIESKWAITAAFPVDSEFAASMNQKDMAAAASSIFISCRKREERTGRSFWSGFGGTGVAHQVRASVQRGLREFEPLNLNPVDEMVASYGRALQVLSENWPVFDGDEPVTPIRAMTEASGVVAQYQMVKLSHGRLNVQDLVPEAGIALTLFGIYGLGDIPFDDVLSLARSLNISLENRSANYKVGERMIGINEEKSTRSANRLDEEAKGYNAPLLSKGSKLRLASPEERDSRRLEEPQSEWDILQGLLMAYRAGDVPVAREYLFKHAEVKEQKMVDLLAIWSENVGDEKQKKEADRLIYGLKLQA